MIERAPHGTSPVSDPSSKPTSITWESVVSPLRSYISRFDADQFNSLKEELAKEKTEMKGRFLITHETSDGDEPIELEGEAPRKSSGSSLDAPPPKEVQKGRFTIRDS